MPVLNWFPVLKRIFAPSTCYLHFYLCKRKLTLVRNVLSYLRSLLIYFSISISSLITTQSDFLYKILYKTILVTLLIWNLKAEDIVNLTFLGRQVKILSITLSFLYALWKIYIHTLHTFKLRNHKTILVLRNFNLTGCMSLLVGNVVLC